MFFSLASHIVIFLLSSMFTGVLLPPPDSLAQDIDIEQLSQELADEIMSPYCPGRTLAACPSDDARKLRLRISSQLSEGYSKAAVKRQLVGIYGKDILGAPSYSGFGLVAWILPFTFFISALIIMTIFLRSKKKAKTESGVPNLNNLESELKSKAKE